MDEYMPTITPEQLLAVVDDFVKTASSRYSALEGVVALLAANFKNYTWTGIYILDGDTLKLGPYRGSPSPHETIPVDQGICGAAIREKKTIIVPDVSADPRYLSCSMTTKSEIVVPIFDSNGKAVAEIDIDSDSPNDFGETDRKLLENIAGKLSQLF